VPVDCAHRTVAVLLRHRAAVSVIAVGYALVGAGFLVIGVAPGLVTAAGAIAVISLGEMLYKPTAPAYLVDCAPAGMQARYQSLYAGASVGGMTLGPALGGFGYEHAGNLAGVRGARRPGRDRVVATRPPGRAGVRSRLV
jgi:MFS family permease